MNQKINGLGAVAAAAALIVGGAVVAGKAGTTETAGSATTTATAPTSGSTGSTSGTTSSADNDQNAPGDGGPGGPGGGWGHGDGRGGHGGPGGMARGTAVTGDELTKLTAAVKAKDAAVTVDQAVKLGDGSYLVMGTKAGNRIGFKVSSDLKTITEQTMPQRGGQRGTAVSGTELTKVTAAVTAKDSAVTVTQVFKMPDGSYHVDGMKAGAEIGLRVSSDLKTVAEQTRPGRGTAVTGDELTKVTAAVKAKDSAVTVTRAFKVPDGSYRVEGAKNGARVGFSVSSDLKTVTEHDAGGRGPGGHAFGTEVTGAELTKVTAAVKAKDSAVTVEKVFKLGDGSYRVMGTKSGNRIGFTVSADLKTVTQLARR